MPADRRPIRLSNLRGTDSGKMSQTHTLFVCTTCASVWQNGKPVGTSGGQKLLASLEASHREWPLRDRIALQPVNCMSACSRSCAVSLAAEGKYTYLFGDLPVEPDAIAATAAAILECASQYYAKTDGLLPWAERPEPLKKGVLARIPPLAEVA